MSGADWTEGDILWDVTASSDAGMNEEALERLRSEVEIFVSFFACFFIFFDLFLVDFQGFFEGNAAEAQGGYRGSG